MMKRWLKACMVALPLMVQPLLAGAQEYPSRPIRLVIPLPPGGGTDTLGRYVAQVLSGLLGLPIDAFQLVQGDTARVPSGHGHGGEPADDPGQARPPQGGLGELGRRTDRARPAAPRRRAYRRIGPVALLGQRIEEPLAPDVDLCLQGRRRLAPDEKSGIARAPGDDPLRVEHAQR